MSGNLNKRVIGKCSQCGGVVSVDTVSMSVLRPIPTCERCGAVADEARNLPVVPTRGGHDHLPRRNRFGRKI